ncbi:hypothetical protein D3C75_1033950 [compost metagenome]
MAGIQYHCAGSGGLAAVATHAEAILVADDAAACSGLQVAIEQVDPGTVGVGASDLAA